METAQIDLFTNYASEVLALISQDWKYKYISNTSNHVLGYTAEELADTPFFAKIFKDDLENVIKQTENSKSRNSVFTLNYRMIRKDGSTMWIENTLRKVEDSYVSVIRDITSEKSAEDLLKRFMEAVEKLFRLYYHGEHQ